MRSPSSSTPAAIALAALMLLVVPTRAHDGAKFEPADGRVLHGAGQSPAAFDNYTQALGDPALTPFVTKAYFPVWDRWPKLWHEGNATFDELVTNHYEPFEAWLAAQHGRMPEVSMGFPLYDGTYGDRIILSGDLDPVIEFAALQIKAFGEPVFVRPGFEPRVGQYTPGETYITAYRRVVDIFRALEVDNAAFVWCAGPVNGVLMAVEDLWFPGDTYVDWVGLDLFSEQHFLPNAQHQALGLPYPPGVVAMLELANSWRKPVILSEVSAVFPGGISDPSPAAADAYWDLWFEPFFQLIRDNPRIKAFCYIDWDWPAEGLPLWADARLENNPHLAARYAQEMADPRYLHRGATEKFPAPWITSLGRQGTAGDIVTIRVENAAPHAPILWSHGEALLVQPGNTGYVDYDLGEPAGNGFWHLADPYEEVGVVFADANGRFELWFVIPNWPELPGTTQIFQTAVTGPDGERLTRAYELAID